MKRAIFLDFDETITRLNVTDTVLERFADPLWREIQEDWLAGKLSAREVLERQMPLITVQPRDLNALTDSIEVDPFFAEFARIAGQEDNALYILSDGFDYWIERILRRALSHLDGALRDIPIFACSLRMEGNQVDISFPYFPQGCPHGCATCKPTLFNRLKAGAERTIVVGDGISDLLIARSADLVLAKGRLRQFCQREGITCYPFEDFRDVSHMIYSFR
jgi:2,3-diketo-5-methylthio-1-phosphopentane phosphatase